MFYFFCYLWILFFFFCSAIGWVRVFGIRNYSIYGSCRIPMAFTICHVFCTLFYSIFQWLNERLVLVTRANDLWIWPFPTFLLLLLLLYLYLFVFFFAFYIFIYKPTKKELLTDVVHINTHLPPNLELPHTLNTPHQHRM